MHSKKEDIKVMAVKSTDFQNSSTVKLLLILLLHPFNGLFSRTTWVSRHQNVNHSGFYWSKRRWRWQWHQLSLLNSAINSQ